MAAIKFNAGASGHAIIGKIVERAIDLMKKRLIDIDSLDLTMDITATHCNGCPIDLEKLLGAPDFDFMHDIAGIQRHINRRNGKLEDLFVPRCAASNSVPA